MSSKQTGREGNLAHSVSSKSDTPTADAPRGKPSEGLRELHEHAKDIYITKLEHDVETIRDFAKLIVELGSEDA